MMKKLAAAATTAAVALAVFAGAAHAEKYHIFRDLETCREHADRMIVIGGRNVSECKPATSFDGSPGWAFTFD
ncbi:hypothetical protein ACIGO9_19760 [Nocardia asteroides]|uniref:hypothetical protein n=1 Tax=Nocardia asteroides TaxID=1824 RepID=UPI0037C9373D